jgi:hypothetical protein
MDTISPSERRLGEEALLDVYRSQSISFAPTQTPINYGPQFMTQSWPPQPSAMWNEACTSHLNWQADPFASEILAQEGDLYASEKPNLESPQYKYEPSAVSNAAPSYLQQYISPVNDVSPDYSISCPSQTPQAAAQPLYTNIPTSDGPGYSHQFGYSTYFHSPMSHDAARMPIGNEPIRSIHAGSAPLPDLDALEAPSKELVLDWSTSGQVTGPSTTNVTSSYQAIIPKRKHTSPEPVAKKPSSSQNELDEFVVVFENAPGALASVKRRRKLDAPVRKAARDVRKAGACHQCRFRKRTVSQQILQRSIVLTLEIVFN